MKLTYSVLSFLLLPCVAMASVDTSAIKNATTIDGPTGSGGLIEAYDKTIKEIIKSYTGKVDKSELDAATQKATDNMEAVMKAVKDGSIDDTDDNTSESTDGDTGTQTERRLSDEDKQAQLAELESNARAMREKEQSFQNRMLGAAGIASVGIGLQKTLSGMAEQRADAHAEEDMRQYLSTFTCNYGGGKQHKLGDTNIEVPLNGNMFGLYQEYTLLADNLKKTKNSLGLKPGIESEVVIDKASSGLYDDVAVGKTGGGYPSIARAILNPDGEDAKQWQKQIDAAAQKTKTGAITAITGAVGTAALNVAMNSGKDKQNKANEIKQKYAGKIKNFEKAVAALPDQTKDAKCPADATGTYPDCTCTDTQKVHNNNTNACEPCGAGQTINNGQCITESTPDKQDDTPPPAAQPDAEQPNVDTSQDEESQQPTTPPMDNKVIDINLDATSLFKLGSAELTPEAKQTISEHITQLATDMTQSEIAPNDICVTITGHTDKSGSNTVNDKLSKQRADAVMKYMQGLQNTIITSQNTSTTGRGSRDCQSTRTYEPACRRVHIIGTYGTCGQ